MGDMLSLIEKAEANFDEEQAAKLQEKLKKNRFTLADYYDQLKQLRKMGSLSDIMGMLPGMKGKVNEEDIDESILTRTEAIIQSMTPAERDDPSLLNASRRKRIAAGSGTTVQQVNQVLKQFDMMQNLTRSISGGKMPKALKGMMGGGMPGMGGFGGGGMGGGHSKGRTKPNKKRKKKR